MVYGRGARSRDALPPSELVWAGAEPKEFTNLFPVWRHDAAVEALNKKVSALTIILFYLLDFVNNVMGFQNLIGRSLTNMQEVLPSRYCSSLRIRTSFLAGGREGEPARKLVLILKMLLFLPGNTSSLLGA